jgi:N-formylglutamate amidohydrolase
LIEATHRRFGLCVLLDCHSMPSESQTTQRARGGRQAADIVFGDFFGASCAPALVAAGEAAARACGLETARNNPYAGGFITRHYGQPDAGIHVLQIEIGRWLYMDEGTLERRQGGFDKLAGDLYHIASAIDAEARKTLGRRPPPAA